MLINDVTQQHAILAEPHDRRLYCYGLQSDNSSVLTLTHLLTPSACTTNSLLMCTGRYSQGWVWTLAHEGYCKADTHTQTQGTHTHIHRRRRPAELFT